MEQLIGANRLVNENVYLSDAADVWKSPLEFFAQRGDCEDYVIAKWASLKKLGFDESRLRLLIVTDTVTRQPHAVLAVDMPDGTYILDNQNREVKRHEELRYPTTGEWHYQPIFALTRTKQWLYGRPA
jgi:predicted transglutaminase-like cysteine proteinase